jgi:UrcA family protein
MIIRKATVFAIGFAALLGAPAIAFQPRQDSAAIRYADLDLSTSKGVSALRRRVATALEAVCGSYAGTESSAGQVEADEISKCRAENAALVDTRVAALISANVRVAAAR